VEILVEVALAMLLGGVVGHPIELNDFTTVQREMTVSPQVLFRDGHSR
jgi:hypothetical protein